MFSSIGLLKRLNGLNGFVQTRGAARKGKRIKAAMEARKKASARREEEKSNPKKKRTQQNIVKVDKGQLRFLDEYSRDSLPMPPQDDVYFMESFRKPRFSFEECIEFHRQAVHPTVLNLPDSIVEARIELNLKLKQKKKKYIERFASTLCYPYFFTSTLRPRKIIALSKDDIDQVEAKKAGAFISGGMDLINLLKTSQITYRDFDYLVCHNNILLDLANTKGMRGSSFFPSNQRGNFGDDVVALVKFFKNGLDYELVKEEQNKSIGCVDCAFGRLDMPIEHLRENMIEFMKSVNRFKPVNMADDLQFFNRVLIKTPSTNEMFVMKFWELMDDYVDPDQLQKVEEIEESQSDVC